MHYQTPLEQSIDKRRDLTKLLSLHGITPTQQRLEIGLVMLNKAQHLSAEQVLESVNKIGNLASKATVYNTLGLFVRKGLIREVIVDPTKVFYDSNITPHYHFYNVDDGTLHDVNVDQIEISQLPTPPQFAAIKEIDIVVRVHNAIQDNATQENAIQSHAIESNVENSTDNQVMRAPLIRDRAENSHQTNHASSYHNIESDSNQQENSYLNSDQDTIELA